MVLTPRNHAIALDLAARMTRRWRDYMPDLEKGGTFHADQVRDLMAQPECVALRYYHGLNDDGTYALILVGMDPASADLTDGTMLELHFPCPPYCALPNDLNSSDPAAERARRVYRRTPLVLPPRDHHIAPAEAARMTRRYRRAFPQAEKGGAFRGEQVRELLEQPDCIGLRYYHALDEAGKYAMILVAMDPEGADMTEGTMLELHFPCPPYCDEPNLLNSDVGALAVAARWHRAPSPVVPA